MSLQTEDEEYIPPLICPNDSDLPQEGDPEYEKLSRIEKIDVERARVSKSCSLLS